MCESMDRSPPGSSVHGISQARMLDWIAISFSRGSSWPRERTHISCFTSWFFTAEPLGKLLFSSFMKAFFPGEFCNFMSWLIGNGFPKIHLLRLCSAFIVTKYFKNTVINRPRACMQAQLLTSCPTWRFLPLKTWRCVPPLSTNPMSLFQFECDKESPNVQLRSANGCQLAQVRPWLSKGNFGELKKTHTEYNKTESESHSVVSDSL